MAKKNEEIQRKFDIAQRDRAAAAAVGASFSSSPRSTQTSRPNVSYGAGCAQSQSKPGIMSPPSIQTFGMSCGQIQSAGSACGPLSPNGRARIRPLSSHMAVVGNVGASTGSQASSQTSTISSRQLQSAGNAVCRLQPKGRGRVRAQSPNMAGAGNVGASTGPHTTGYGRMTLTPTEQPESKQKERGVSGVRDLLSKSASAKSHVPLNPNAASFVPRVLRAPDPPTKQASDGNVGASTGSQPPSLTSTISSRQLQSAGNARCRLPPKGRGRGRAQPPNMAGVGKVGASTGPHTTTYGRMTLTPTEQPESKKKMRDSDSDSLLTASFPSSKSPSLHARKKPESKRFAGLQGALLGLVTEVHAKNETLKMDQSTLFSGHVQVVSTPNKTPNEHPGPNQR
ncbi:uncharacterized protein LOC135812715 [Sycon ciliatum]|uniref:uncharacterized protein LOC135812715 n=1 Tax=Sycon ciliatum TaxID=27933 RepID=UPI0031F5FCB2